MFEKTDDLLMIVDVFKKFSPVFMALVSAIIGYQFSRRSKEKDSFLEQLSTSYEKLYFPMYLSLMRIREKSGEDKMHLINEFFSYYETDASNLKLMSRTYVLEYFFKLRTLYLEFIAENHVVAKEKFWNCFDRFYLIIENECWDSHDLLYKDYIKLTNYMVTNPLLRIFKEISVFLYNLSTFILYIIGVILYFTLWNYIMPLNLFPDWWNFKIALLLFLVVVGIHCFILILASWYLSTKNKREGKLKYKIKQKAIKGVKRIVSKVAQLVN